MADRGRRRRRKRRRLPPSHAVLFAFATLTEAQDRVLLTPRNFSGIGNNVANPSWGAAGTTQIRSVVGADYAADGITPPGNLRPSAREIMTEVFLSSTPVTSTRSALFVAWGQLLTYDMYLNVDNTSEPFNIACDDGGGLVDVWCPQGAASEDISFFRSDAEMADSDSDSGSVRSPVNYATAYIDLDFVYGRSEEDAEALRTLEGGLMNVTGNGVPFQNADGTWLIADQRTAQFPVTFALHISFLLEHNRCCIEVAPNMGYEGDEDVYQACRAWTIALFQHISENDYFIRLLGSSVASLGTSFDASTAATGVSPSSSSISEQGARARALESTPTRDRRRLYALSDYQEDTNPSADVFTMTVGAASFESAIPSTVRIVSEGYIPTAYDRVELTVARENMAVLFEKNSVEDILRGAVLSPGLEIDTYYSAAVSNLSPLFKLPVDAVQRGRDHGLPTYNAARLAFDLAAAADFSDVTEDEELAALLSDAHGGDIDSLDACTGALAESSQPTSGDVLGELMGAAWSEQLYRSLIGDRFHHLHSRPIEDVSNTTLGQVLSRTVNLTDLPMSVFDVPGVTVCAGNCKVVGTENVTLSDSFKISWEVGK